MAAMEREKAQTREPARPNGESSRPGRRWLKRTAGAAGALSLGVWISFQFWPHWMELQDRHPPKPDVVPVVQPAFVPAPAPDKQNSVLGTDASISDKPLQLVLVATAPGATLTDGTATLGTDPRNPQTYAGGAVLANGARIEEIHADRVLLTLNGKREALLVDRDSASRAAMTAQVNGVRGAPDNSVQASIAREGQAGSLTSIGGGGSGQQDRIASSREDLSEFLRPQPVFENDRFIGLKIFPGTSPDRLAALGMEAGDVIRSIEGRLIESDSAWQEIDDALSSGGTIVVGVERNGSLMSISLDGRQLASGSPSG